MTEESLAEAAARVRGPALVTGATGFIGRRLVDRLESAAVRVRALLLEAEAVPEDWSAAIAGDSIEVVRGDVCDERSLESAIDGVGTVFHLAALVAEQNSDYDAHWRVTAEGSRSVYHLAATAGARVVVTTSICAYGDAISKGVCSEESERGLHQGPYGRAKQGQEDFALEAHRERGLDVTILRPSNVYGIGSKPWFEMLTQRLRSGSMVVIGSDQSNAGLVYVDNLVDALVAAAGSGAGNGRIYNVCDGLPVTWRQYMNDLASAVGAAPPPLVPREALQAAALSNEDPKALVGPKSEEIPPLELLNLVGSDNRFPTARIQKDLGWSPRIGYDEALRTMTEYLRTR